MSLVFAALPPTEVVDVTELTWKHGVQNALPTTPVVQKL